MERNALRRAQLEDLKKKPHGIFRLEDPVLINRERGLEIFFNKIRQVFPGCQCFWDYHFARPSSIA